MFVCVWVSASGPPGSLIIIKAEMKTVGKYGTITENKAGMMPNVKMKTSGSVKRNWLYKSTLTH